MPDHRDDRPSAAPPVRSLSAELHSVPARRSEPVTLASAGYSSRSNSLPGRRWAGTPPGRSAASIGDMQSGVTYVGDYPPVALAAAGVVLSGRLGVRPRRSERDGVGRRTGVGRRGGCRYRLLCGRPGRVCGMPLSSLQERLRCSAGGEYQTRHRRLCRSLMPSLPSPCSGDGSINCGCRLRCHSRCAAGPIIPQHSGCDI